MKRRLFKKFFEVENNAYYIAVIEDRVYFASDSKYPYFEKWGPFTIRREEEQYFMSIRIPEAILLLLNKFVESSEEQINFTEAKEDIKTKLLEEHEKSFNDSLTQLRTQFESDVDFAYYIKGEKIYHKHGLMKDMLENPFENKWKSDFIDQYTKRGEHFVYEEYNGLATRGIWLMSSHEDIVSLTYLKLFGDEKDYNVLEVKRFVMFREMAEQFVIRALKQIR